MMLDWIKKIAGYAPDIAAAVATGGSSLAATGLRILGKELLGNESASESDIEKAVAAASPEQLVNLARCNNEFKAEMKRLENEAKRDLLQDKQSEHLQTQETIRNGDNSDSTLVRTTRPLQSWASLVAAFFYVFTADSIDVYVLGALLTLPFTYAGLRQAGKWKTADSLSKIAAVKK